MDYRPYFIKRNFMFMDTDNYNLVVDFYIDNFRDILIDNFMDKIGAFNIPIMGKVHYDMNQNVSFNINY